MSEIEQPAPKLQLVPGLAYKGSIQVGLHWQPQWSDEGAERLIALSATLTPMQWEELREWYRFRRRDALQAIERATKARQLLWAAQVVLQKHGQAL